MLNNWQRLLLDLSRQIDEHSERFPDVPGGASAEDLQSWATTSEALGQMHFDIARLIWDEELPPEQNTWHKKITVVSATDPDRHYEWDWFRVDAHDPTSWTLYGTFLPRSVEQMAVWYRSSAERWEI